MNNKEILDKQYWDEVINELDKKDNNSARRHRRYNKSLEAMGEKTVMKEGSKQYTDNEFIAFDAIMNFIDTIENEKLLKALKALKSDELQIIIYRFVHKMHISEIAKVLNKGVSTVSERLGRIICKIIKEMSR